jgi:hypothetical protein
MVKWGGPAVTVLLVVLWTGGGWYHLSWRGLGGFGVGVREGRLRCGVLNSYGRSILAPGISLRLIGQPTPSVTLFTVTPVARFVAVPLWLVSGPLLLMTAIAWRLDTLARRRAHAGSCPKCGYDRTGIGDDVICPECGTLKV